MSEKQIKRYGRYVQKRKRQIIQDAFNVLLEAGLYDRIRFAIRVIFKTRGWK